MPQNTLCTLYNSFIQSHMLYGILNWGSAAKTNLEPLKRSLRKVVRIIDFAKYQAHSEPLFKKYNLLNLTTCIKSKLLNSCLIFITKIVMKFSITFSSRRTYVIITKQDNLQMTISPSLWSPQITNKDQLFMKESKSGICCQRI